MPFFSLYHGNIAVFRRLPCLSQEMENLPHTTIQASGPSTRRSAFDSKLPFELTLSVQFAYLRNHPFRATIDIHANQGIITRSPPRSLGMLGHRTGILGVSTPTIAVIDP